VNPLQHAPDQISLLTPQLLISVRLLTPQLTLVGNSASLIAAIAMKGEV